jgi:chemotaxis protein CheD
MNPPGLGHVRPGGRTVFLKPSETFLGGPGDAAGRVTTILGSCVSVTFYCARRRVGAICHALLPRCPAPAACRSRCADHGRFVACVLPALLKRLRGLGIAPRDVACGVFGGSDLFGIEGRSAVGRGNAETALGFLEAARLRPAARDTGGRTGRKLIFDTETGEIWLKRLGPTGRREAEASWKKF